MSRRALRLQAVCDDSVRTESLLDPGDSLCWVEDEDEDAAAAATAAAVAAAAAAERTGGNAPDDICRNKLTRWGTVVRRPPCRLIPWIAAAAAAGGTMEARESPEAGCTRGTRDASCGNDGWEADKCLTSRLKLPDCRACALLGDGCCVEEEAAAAAAAAANAAGSWASCSCCCSCCCCCAERDGGPTGCWMSDSWEAVREAYWKLRLARGVCTGGLHMAAVKEHGDMMAPCCWSGACTLIEEEFRLPWERLGTG
ncbi:hypothetical protein EYF80_004317 [Liparis tanakae]|uniref:Uncharacterized protein n=1 Tax=Liparis tanakae TaxID=230148 RepID=A0A4Z2J4L4_9TELE|nr:hypothetical protein EYF80_004317 [Liparis tanakae]